jgi:CRISPR/Cas system-associated endonuclease Cas1
MEFSFLGGIETTNLKSIQSIMIYGKSDVQLDLDIINDIASAGIPIVIHRRRQAQPTYIFTGCRSDVDDTMSAQLLKRSRKRYATHVSRQLLIAKMRSMSYLVKPTPIPRLATIKTLRSIEAIHARRYWAEFFKKIGHQGWTRRGDNPVAETLDATSGFVSGVIMRWVVYHHLSPYHGFLHESTTYPALVYDLMEPYRGVFERTLMKTFIKEKDSTKWTSAGIAAIEKMLDEETYIPLTRQIATNQELLHGIVLSLKQYVLGKQRKFLVPLSGHPQGGRPPKVNFMLYGRSAGRTDFYKEAEAISKKAETQ